MKYFRQMTVALTLAALALAATAQQQDETAQAAETEGKTESPPAPGQPKPFELPEVERFSLDNGLDVALVQYGDVPKVSVRLVTRTGNIDEQADQVWLADLTGDLMEEGAAELSAQELASAVAAMGGNLNVGVGINEVTIGGDVLSENATEMIGLVADVARTPRLPAAEIDRLKRDLLRRVSIARSQPQQIAFEKFRRVLYGDHPYGRIFPSEAMVQGYTIEEVQAFHSNQFGAARSTLYVVGVFDEPSVRQAIGAAFGDWPAGAPASEVSVEAESERAVHLIHRPGAVQSTIYLGLPVIPPTNSDYVPLAVTNTLLGGYFSSRVTSNIREDKGYTYSPRSTVAVQLGSAYYAQIADVTTDVTGPALTEIFSEINLLQSEPPSEEELRAVQNYLAGTFVLQNSSRGGIINQLAFLKLHGLDEDYLRNYVQRVMALEPADIQEMAKTYLRDEDMTIVVAGDREVIEEQVGELGEVRVEQPKAPAPEADDQSEDGGE